MYKIPQKQLDLFNKYPDLFYYALCENDSSWGPGYHDSIKEFGLETSDTWFDHIAEACEKLKDCGIRISQIKQKFGSLCFYFHGEGYDVEYVRDVIDEVIYKCSITCEVCGKEGKVRGDLRWISVLCEEHYKGRK